MVDLVWDQERTCTCTSSGGGTMTIGEANSWPPEDLLAGAAASCLMRTFLGLAGADGVEVLGYVASAHASAPEGGVLALEIQTCVVVKQGVDLNRVHALGGRAKETSPVARALGDRLTLRLSVRTVGAEPCPGN